MTKYTETQREIASFLRDFAKPARPADVAAWLHITTVNAKSALLKLEKKGCVSTSLLPNPVRTGPRQVTWYSYVKDPAPLKLSEEKRSYFREKMRRVRELASKENA
jgi:predicted ArsR family transcriptional regulator